MQSSSKRTQENPYLLRTRRIRDGVLQNRERKKFPSTPISTQNVITTLPPSLVAAATSFTAQFFHSSLVMCAVLPLFISPAPLSHCVPCAFRFVSFCLCFFPHTLWPLFQVWFRPLGRATVEVCAAPHCCSPIDSCETYMDGIVCFHPTSKHSTRRKNSESEISSSNSK